MTKKKNDWSNVLMFWNNTAAWRAKKCWNGFYFIRRQTRQSRLTLTRLNEFCGKNIMNLDAYSFRCYFGRAFFQVATISGSMRMMKMLAEWMGCVLHQNELASVERVNVNDAMDAILDELRPVVLSMRSVGCLMLCPALADATEYLKGLLKRLPLLVGYFVQLHYY